MKILVAYYSKSGHTEQIAEAVKKQLEDDGHSVDLEKIRAKKELSFWKWLLLRAVREDCEIEPPKIADVSNYDAICIGSPNWARISLPVAGYINTVKGLKGKSISFFSATLLWPLLEWLFFSAFLFESSLANKIEKKDGRIIASLFLPGSIKSRNVFSPRGKIAVKSFCNKIEAAPAPYAEFALRRREEGLNRLFVISILSFFVWSFAVQMILPLLNIKHFTLNQYFSVIIIGVFFVSVMLAIMKERKLSFLLKYLTFLYLTIAWTMTIFFFNFKSGMQITPGYIFILFLCIMVQEPRVTFYLGILTILGYGVLYIFYPIRDVFLPHIDLMWLVMGICYALPITINLKKYLVSLLTAREEIEMEKNILEIKIIARTRELRELAKSLDVQIKNKTQELQEKVNELEKFNKLSVGREIKMMELKSEIRELKESLSKK